MPGLKTDRERAIPISYLRECFSLDKHSGQLFWKVRPKSHFKSERGWKNFNKQFASNAAGSVGSDGYTRVWVMGRQLLGHRVVFAIANGAWPKEEVDHRDRDRHNSAPQNLREAGPARNQWNIGKTKANKSGAKGVSCEGTAQFPACQAVNAEPHPETGSRVVLTIAHMDHDPGHNDPANLRALCQRCHLAWDRPHHAENASITRRLRAGQPDLFRAEA